MAEKDEEKPDSLISKALQAQSEASRSKSIEAQGALKFVSRAYMTLVRFKSKLARDEPQ